MPNSMTRRQFMLRSGALSGAVATEIAGLGVTSTPVHAQSAPKLTKVGKEVPTVCPYCAVGCGQIARVPTWQNVTRWHFAG